jgi:hypothetical protein
VILPCPSFVWGEENRLYFFIQMQQPYHVWYCVAEQIGDEWKVDYV